MDDLDNYVLEQSKIEVEHTRFWPTKILAFYVAMNAGVVTALFSITTLNKNPLYVPICVKLFIMIAILSLLFWAFILLKKNHINYLKYRNIQIHFQKDNEKVLKERFPVPGEWFLLNELSLLKSWEGWSFYFYLMVLVTALALIGVWIS